MNFIDAFLTISGVAYFLCLPFKCTLNLDLLKEKLFFILSGGLILASIYLVKLWYVYLGISIFYGAAALMSWLGVSKWKFSDWTEMSPIHQVAMFAWDLLIALCFMMKV